MDHGYFKDRISAFHDGELKHEEEVLIARHIEECEECRKLLDDLKKFDSMIADHSGLAESDYWEKQAKRIDRAIGIGEGTEVTDIRQPSGSGLWWKVTAAVAALAALTFVALHEGDILKSVEGPSERAVELPRDIFAPQPLIDTIAREMLKQEKDAESIDSPAEQKALTEIERISPEELTVKVTADSKKLEEFTVRGGRSAETTYQVIDSQALAQVKRLPEKPSEPALAIEEKPATEPVPSVPPNEAPKVPDLALAEAQQDAADSENELTGVAESERTLEEWRKIVAMAEQGDAKGRGEGLVGKEVASGVARTKSLAAQSDTMADSLTVATTVDQAAKERELIEAWYHIGRLTDVTKERERAVAFLKDKSKSARFHTDLADSLYHVLVVE